MNPGRLTPAIYSVNVPLCIAVSVLLIVLLVQGVNYTDMMHLLFC